MVAPPAVAPFHIDIQPERSRVRVVPVGELDIAAVDRLADSVHELRRVGFDRVVLDLSRLSFMDSSGLRTILVLDAEARDAEQDLTLIPGPAAVQRVLELAGVCRRLRFVQS